MMTSPSDEQNPRLDRCPTCHQRPRVEPSAVFGEVSCSCGTQLWYLQLEPVLRVYKQESAQQIRERVVAFAARQLEIPASEVPSPTFYWEDLGTDSLTTIELAVKLEKEISDLSR